jgi:hypothetical protein
MVSKCFNPACSTPFHSLAEGTVFRLEPDGSFTNTTVDAEYTDAQLFMAIQRRYPVQNHRDRSGWFGFTCDKKEKALAIGRWLILGIFRQREQRACSTHLQSSET